MRKFFQKHLLTLLLLLLLSIPFIIHIFQPGFFVGDDGEWMIIRSSAFHEALRDGQFPVRFLGRLNHEFGYPVATFLYPGYLYLTEPVVIAGFSFIDAIKIMFALTMILSGIFTYFWLNKLFDKWSSLIGALVYLYTPYHLVDMYNRGSLGELLALAVVPFIFWNIERKNLLFSVIGIAGLILSHNIMAALFLPVVIVYAFLRDPQKLKKKLQSLIVLLSLSLGLSAFFWIPAVFELANTVFNQVKISEWQNYFAPFAKVGGLPIILLVTALGVLLFRKQLTDKSMFKVKGSLDLCKLFIIIGVGAVFLSSSFSTVLWHILPVTFIQFPFRFLSLEIVSVAFLAAFLFSTIHNNAFRKVYGAIIIIALGVNAFPYFASMQPYDKGEGFYVTNQSTTTTRDEYMPIWVKEKPVQRTANKVVVLQGNGEISNIKLTNKYIAFTADIKEKAKVAVNKIYWPGWNAALDGKETSIDYNNPKGVMTIIVPEGKHSVQLHFQETPLRLFADAISIAAVLLLGGIFLKSKIRKK